MAFEMLQEHSPFLFSSGDGGWSVSGPAGSMARYEAIASPEAVHAYFTSLLERPISVIQRFPGAFFDR